MSLIRCPRCWKQVPQTSAFCRRCGLRLRNAVQPARLGPPPPPKPIATAASRPMRTPVPPPRPPQGKPLRGLFVLILIGAGFAFYRSQHRYTTPPPPMPTFKFDGTRTPPWTVPPSFDPNNPIHSVKPPPRDPLFPNVSPPAQPWPDSTAPRFTPSRQTPVYPDPRHPGSPPIGPEAPSKSPDGSGR